MRLLSSVALLALLGLPAPTASAGATPDLGPDARAAYHRAIEAVRQGHRLWPDTNPAARPSLDSLAPAGLFEARAADAVRKSHALERTWGRPITGAQLQAEIDRLARSTKQPERLAELWATLGNDPVLVAEIVARPLLADRLIREWYAHDGRFHGELEARAREELGRARAAGDLRAAGGRYVEHELTAQAAAGRRTLEPDAWEARLRRLAQRFGADPESLVAGAMSGLRQEAGRFYALAILERDDDHVRLASVEWPKEPFDTWWSRVAGDLPVEIETPAYRYHLPSLVDGQCADDTWRPTLAIPDPRYEHTAVWTGAEVIVWGGMSSVGNFPERGGRYDPATDTWTLVGQAGEPGGARSTPRSGPAPR